MTEPRNGREETDARHAAIVEEATAWFVRMTSDRVSETDRRAFRAWLDRDPEHHAAYAEAEALWSMLADIPDPREASGTWSRLSGVAHRRGADVRAWHRRRPRQAAAMAASLLMAGLLGLWTVGGMDGLRADHSTAVGETREIVLTDGSRVHLNTDTALSVDLGHGCRCVEILRGEAFFTVAPEPGRPFRVAAGDWTAEALGTAFSVRQTGGMIGVAVTESRVRVAPAGAGADDARRSTLSAGEVLRFVPEDGVEMGPADVAALTAWRQGRLVFADKRLRTVVEEIDRYRPGTILFLDGAVADERLTGVFRLDDTDHALAAIETALPVDVIRVTPWLTLLRARD